jgi:WD40 repeat protein/serine/threonine protein kinase
MPAVSLNQFLDGLEKSSLLAADDLARVRDEVLRDSGNGDSKEFARRLVAQQLLTRWQGEMLLAGRHAFFLGRYKLLERIGAGGMGSVFKARQEPLGRLVAIKVVARRLMKDKDSVARFYREIQSAASLGHPNIVAAYDADNAGTTYFLVMEYVDGEDLGSVVKRRGALPIGEASHYIMQAAQGLQHAFERHLVHRDIKPSNLLLTRAAGSNQPVVKLLDMGLARMTDAEADADLTHTGQVMGTPDFIAPEQARDSKTADVRSDIFSLGCTFFRLLTNQVPYTGNTLIEKLLARSERDAPLASSIRGDVPPALDAVISRMLARNPDDRFQTPAEVVAALVPFAHIAPKAATAASADDSSTATNGPVADLTAANTPVSQAIPESGLQHFLNDLGSDASIVHVDDPSTQTAAEATPFASTATPIVPEQIAKIQTSLPAPGIGLRRKSDSVLRWLILGGAGTFLLLIAAYAGWVWTGKTSLIINWPPEMRAGGSITVDGHKIPLSKQGPIKISGDPGKQTLLLMRKGYENIEETLSLERGAVLNYRPQWTLKPETARQEEFTRLADEFRSIEVKQDNEQLVTTLQKKLIEFRRRYPGSPEDLEAAWLMWRLRWPVDRLTRQTLTDEKRMTAGNGDAESAPEQLVAVLGSSRLSHAARNIQSVAFSPDGKLLASSGEDEYIRLWDVTTGKQVRAIHFNFWNCHSLSFSPDGQLLTGAYRDRFVGIWNVQTGKIVGNPREHEKKVFAVAFSPDGKMIASSDEAGTELSDVNTGERLHYWPGQRYEIGFNSDGSMLATASQDNDGEITLWNTRTGESVETDLRGRRYFTVRGSVLACRGENNNLEIWDWKQGGGVYRRTIPLGGGWWPPAISQDGKQLAVINNGNLAIYDATTGELREWKESSSRPPQAQCLEFSPDGKTLAAGFQDGSVRLFAADTGQELFDPEGHHGIITSLAVSPNGRRIASAGLDGSVCLWDVTTAKLVRRIDAHIETIHDIEFLQDGDVLATASHDQLVRLWDANTGKKLREMHDHLHPVFALAVHPDGIHLASAGADRKILIWNTKTHQEPKSLDFHDGHILCLSYSPDGKLLAVGTRAAHSDGVILWDVETGRKSTTIKVADNGCKVVDVCFTADGSRVLFTVRDGGHDAVRVWDLTTGRLAHQPFPGAMDETRVACQPQGRIWASSMGNGSNAVRDTRYGTEEQLFRFGPTPRHVGDIAFTPDGRHLVCGLAGGTLCILRLRQWKAKMKKPSGDFFD